MHNVTRLEGELTIIKRVRCSVNGNPNFIISIAGYKVRTKNDAALNYDIDNLADKKVVAWVGTYYGKLTILDIQKSSN